MPLPDFVRSMIRRSRGLLLAVFLIPAANCNCANVAYDRAYHGAIVRECDAYQHRASASELESDVRDALEAEGYTIEALRSKPNALTTEWREDGESRRRVIVRFSSSAGGTSVRATAAEQHRSAPRYESDGLTPAPEIEAEVVRRLVPALAEKEDAWVIGHRFEMPARIVMEEAARVLQSRGHIVLVRTEGEPMQTQWRGTIDRSARTRYVVEAVQVDSVVRLYTKLEREHAIAGSRRWIAGDSKRDIKTELAIVDARDPAAAASIREKATVEARTAYQQAIDSGAPSCGVS